mmetsp:Transcript_34159/g.78772  ORF Transcript_34159/g.78772 Transcript_34159/m.78772 type:complete len:113 (-) Transcript_34159:151-489(-)
MGQKAHQKSAQCGSPRRCLTKRRHPANNTFLCALLPLGVGTPTRTQARVPYTHTHTHDTYRNKPGMEMGEGMTLHPYVRSNEPMKGSNIERLPLGSWDEKGTLAWARENDSA